MTNRAQLKSSSLSLEWGKLKWGSEFEAVGAIVQSLHVVGLFDDSLDGWTDGWMREKKGGRRKLLDGQRVT